jgi:hypothetical protein
MTILQLFGTGGGVEPRDMLRSRDRDRLPSDLPLARSSGDLERYLSSLSSDMGDRPRDRLRREGESMMKVLSLSLTIFAVVSKLSVGKGVLR